MNLYRRKSGRWLASYKDPTTQKRRSKTFRTKREGEVWLAERHADIARGEHVAPSAVTVGDAVEAWFADLETSASVRPATLDAYRGDIARHIVPHLGSVRLTELTTGMIEDRMVRGMVADGLRPTTIRKVSVPLTRSLNRAVRHGLIRSNPMTAIEWKEILPKAEKRPKPTFTERELRRIIDAAPSDEARAFIGLIAGHGLRVGEVLGLRRKDLGERSIEVAQQASKGRIGSPKTKASERVIPTLPDFVEHLDAARTLAAGKDDEALTFADRRGRPQQSGNAQSLWLWPAQDAAGLPRTGWHALRRSYALMLADRGVSPIDARDLMGHSSIEMTADVYQRDSGAAQVERLQRAVGRQA